MHPRVATALRRSAVILAALATSLTVHAVSMHGHIRVLPFAPMVWAGLLLAATPLLATWRPRTRIHAPEQLVVTLLLLQAVMHAGLTSAPWAFGFAEHHPMSAGIGLLPAAAHVGSAVLLALLLVRWERLLAAAVAVAGRLLDEVAEPSVTPRPERVVHLLAQVVPSMWAGEPSAPRGPPLPAR